MRTAEEILAKDRLWTVRDVAHYLSLSTSWVYKAAADGTLPTVRLGAVLRFDPERIRAFARDGVRSSPVVAMERSRGTK